MYIDFSDLFHRSSKDRHAGGRINIPLDPTKWPAEWHQIVYKEYPRFEKLALIDAPPAADLFASIRARRTKRDFAKRPIPFGALSALLKYSCGIIDADENRLRRAQPSGGGCYPIETYVFVFAGNDAVRSGLYHYNIKQHALDVLWERPFAEEDLSDFFTYPWAHKASIAIMLTAVFERNQRKYGERGYRQILIEAGEIVQNIYLIASALGLSCCAIDGVNEENIEKVLDIDGVSESVIVSLVLG